MEPHKVEMLFVLTDIGGYTQFMLHNQKEPEHAQSIITKLMEAMIHHEKMPLRIAEVEGDALFLYAIKENELQWTLEKETIAGTLESFFVAFYAEVGRLMQDKLCTCEVCTTIESLRIKVIAHYGEAVIDQLERFTTINGVDAIVAHRLLKNSLHGDYVLVTERAFKECPFPDPARFKPHQEHYDDIGTVNAFTYIPERKA